jgi:PTH1 family peptidyl-tRNA hydrolase
MSTLKLIVGLGNPGPRYVYNRHNIGFQCVDLFSQRHNIGINKMQMKARTGDGWVQKRTSPLDIVSGALPQMQRQKVLLVKPLTYMNLSGEAVGQLMRYYDVDPEDLIVVHDDLDLDSGKLRLRSNGGSGGQNGIKSIIQHLGTPDFARARVGIGRPPGRMDPANYVLKNFTEDDEIDFGPLRQTILDALECWLFEGVDTAMNQFNG